MSYEPTEQDVEALDPETMAQHGSFVRRANAQAEREQGVEALADSIAVCFSNVSDLPEWMQVPALGRDMRPLTVIAARAVLRSDWYAERIAHARREHRLEWADYIEHWSGAIGPEPPTVESLVAALRRDHPPFGGPVSRSDLPAMTTTYDDETRGR